jgi:hypothetical protein
MSSRLEEESLVPPFLPVIVSSITTATATTTAREQNEKNRKTEGRSIDN